MSLIGRYKIQRAAARDAQLGIDAKADHLTAALGLSPEENAQGSFRYRTAVAAAANTASRDEIAEDIRRLEDGGATIGSAAFLALALVAIWLTEIAGALLLMRTLNVPTTTRPFAAFALTLALVGLTHAATRARTRSLAPEDASPAGAISPEAVTPPRHSQGVAAILLPLLFGVLASAIAFARVASSIAEGGPLLPALAEAVITVAISVGPAFAAVHVTRRLRRTIDTARQLRRLRARLAKEERAIKNAGDYLRAVDRKERDWRDEAARRAALYRATHRLTTADAGASRARGSADDTAKSAPSAPSGDAPASDDFNNNPR